MARETLLSQLSLLLVEYQELEEVGMDVLGYAISVAEVLWPCL
jgi:hypothetical protein